MNSNNEHTPLPPLGNGGNHSQEKEQTEENKKNLKYRLQRRLRLGFSDSLATLDMSSLRVEEGGRVPFPRGEVHGFSCGQESETFGSNTSTFPNSEYQHSDANNNWNVFVNFIKKGSQMPLQTLQHPLKNVSKLRRKNHGIREDQISLNSPSHKPNLDPEFYRFKSSWKNFSLADLQSATNYFSRDNLIGEGGYAEVYKGKLEDGNYVAIKRLTRGDQEEMTADFLSELGIIVHVDHPNIARVIGYGVEGGMHLVLQLSPHGSLASILYGPRERLDWNMRYKIAVGIAKGLHYLHEECQRRIIHRDIKAANILLSQDFEAQIADFGLAKWLPDQWTHHTVSNFEGTFGYLPPEFFMHGIVDEKTDVYAYGVLLLELITGRQAIDSSQKSLVMWAKPLLSTNKTEELIDPYLANAYDEEQMKHIILIASLCIDQSSVRPQMNQILQLSRGEEYVLKLVKELNKSKLQRTYSEELLYAEEYNSTKILSDMDRHMLTILDSSNSSEDETIQKNQK